MTCEFLFVCLTLEVVDVFFPQESFGWWNLSKTGSKWESAWRWQDVWRLNPAVTVLSLVLKDEMFQKTSERMNVVCVMNTAKKYSGFISEIVFVPRNRVFAPRNCLVFITANVLLFSSASLNDQSPSIPRPRYPRLEPRECRIRAQTRNKNIDVFQRQKSLIPVQWRRKSRENTTPGQETAHHALSSLSPEKRTTAFFRKAQNNKQTNRWTGPHQNMHSTQRQGGCTSSRLVLTSRNHRLIPLILDNRFKHFNSPSRERGLWLTVITRQNHLCTFGPSSSKAALRLGVSCRRHSLPCIILRNKPIPLEFHLSLGEGALIAFVLLAQQNGEVNIAVHWGVRKSRHKFSISLIACFHFSPAAEPYT